MGSTVGTIQPNAQELKRQVSDIEKQVAKLIERVVDTDNATIAAAYEKKITQLEREKLVTTEKIQNSGKPNTPSMKCLNSLWDFSQVLGKYGVLATFTCAK